MLISGIFAAIVAILATISIEKFGGKLGGLLSSIPSTVVPASIGFWFAAQDQNAFLQSIYTVPLGMLVNGLFLYSWRILPSKISNAKSLIQQLLLMIIGSLGVWAIGAFSLMQILHRIDNLPAWSLGGFCTLLIFGILACRGNPPAPKGGNRISVITLLSRGILAGLAIGFAVFLASLGSSLLAGMTSVFPAIFLTTMVSIWLSQGQAVQLGAVGPMILGSASVAFYALLCAWSFPIFGVLWGALLSWFGAVILISIPSWQYLKRQRN